MRKVYNLDGDDITFNIMDVAGDGACLFNMLSLAFFNTELYSLFIRQDVVHHIFENYQLYGDFTTHIRTGDGMTREEYAAYMIQPYTYGTHVEVEAASKVFQRRIVVFREEALECDIGQQDWSCVVTEFSGSRDAGHFKLAWPVGKEFFSRTLTRTPIYQEYVSAKRQLAFQDLSRNPNFGDEFDEEQLLIQSPTLQTHISLPINTEHQTLFLHNSLPNHCNLDISSLKNKEQISPVQGRPKKVKRGRPRSVPPLNI